VASDEKNARYNAWEMAWRRGDGGNVRVKAVCKEWWYIQHFFQIGVYTLATSILAVDHGIAVLSVHVIVSLYMDLWLERILKASNLNQSGRRGNCMIRSSNQAKFRNSLSI